MGFWGRCLWPSGLFSGRRKPPHPNWGHGHPPVCDTLLAKYHEKDDACPLLPLMRGFLSPFSSTASLNHLRSPSSGGEGALTLVPIA